MNTGRSFPGSFGVGVGLCSRILIVALALAGWGLVARAADSPAPLPEKASIRILAPTAAARFVVPGPVVIEAEAIDPAGDIRHLEFFANEKSIGVSDYLLKIAVIPGRPIPHRLEWMGLEAGSYRIVARGKDTLGRPVVSSPVSIRVLPASDVAGVALIKSGADWRYRNDGTDWKDAWRESAFDDAQWPVGPAELGYGDGDEATVTRVGEAPHPITAYFRHAFNLPEGSTFTRLRLRLVRDDGAAVYLNGKEVLRDNLPDGALTFETKASDSTENENAFRSWTLSTEALVPGRNVLAVEVHQANATSSDLSFDLDLQGIGDSALPLITLEVPRPQTSEPRPEARIAPGQILVHRTGDLSRALPVFLDIGGNATPGIDYERIAPVIEIPAGKAEAEILVQAFDDEDVEGTEFVSVEVVQSPTMGPLGSYLIDTKHARAEVTIGDADQPRQPYLAITEPKDGAVVRSGAAISIHATAIDPEGFISRVEFLDGDKVIGVSEIVFLVAPDPGTPIFHQFEWKDATPGAHKIIARAGDPASGPVLVSEPVVVIVGPPLPEVASIVIHSPKEGDVFSSGSTIKILATAVDPTGYISRVVFFDGDQKIGVSEIAFLVAPPDGTPIQHEFDWKGAADGRHKIVARADLVRDVLVESLPVVIQVGKDVPPPAPSLVITEPKSGDNLPAGKPITIHAVAIDPASYINRVEFFDGDKSLGVSEIQFIRAPDPGTPIEHNLVWPDPAPGNHRLVARAVSVAGNRVVSEVVQLRVGGEDPAVLVLAVEASDAAASEPASDGAVDPGMFVIRRVSGPGDIPVPVFLKWAGSADNGVDYAKLDDQVQLPAGADRLEIVVKPLADSRREGAETVILHLVSPVCPAIYPPPAECYQISGRGSATVSIRDASTIRNQPPEVAIVSPKSGSVFALNSAISIEAKAEDSDGKIERLELVADEQVIGTSTENSLKVEWTQADEGTHKLVARVVDDGGAEAFSKQVVIHVRDTRTEAVARRDLPSAYVPGSSVEVLVLVEPPRGAGAWVVEETPPTGWVVSQITEDGALDPVSGKIKFGPYTDSRSRTLGYRVAAPADAKGAYVFAGSISVDGKTSPVGGETTLEPVGEFHPADVAPQDHTISADELTTYAGAWKNGNPWQSDQSLIPVSFVTRAGLIWKRGERYAFDLTKGAPPQCWVPAADLTAPALASTGLRRASDDRQPSVDRDAPSFWKPGRAGEVKLKVEPPSGTSAWAVEETVPSGWRVAAVSDGGEYDAEARRVRWGLFFGSEKRSLQYTVVPPADAACTARFAGMASFDGEEVVIGGLVKAGASDEATELRISSSRHEGSGKSHFRVTAAPDQVFVVEASSDLQTWEEVEAFVFTGDEIQIDDRAAAAGAPGRYYRLRPVGR